MNGRSYWSLFALAACVLAAPLFLVEIPPVLDYPNHMARIYVLAHAATDPVLSKMYAQHWAIIPDLAIDIITPWTLSFLPLHVAGRLVLALALLLPVLGAAVYSRVLFGR